MFWRNLFPLRPRGFYAVIHSPLYLLLKLRSALEEIPNEFALNSSQFLLFRNNQNANSVVSVFPPRFFPTSGSLSNNCFSFFSALAEKFFSFLKTKESRQSTKNPNAAPTATSISHISLPLAPSIFRANPFYL